MLTALALASLLPIGTLPTSSTAWQVPRSADTTCAPLLPPGSEDESGVDSTRFTLGGQVVKLCYQSARVGTEAELAVLSSAGPLSIAGLRAPAGSYWLLVTADETQWHLVVRRADLVGSDPDTRFAEIGGLYLPREVPRRAPSGFSVRVDEASPDHVLVFFEWPQNRLVLPLVKR